MQKDLSPYTNNTECKRRPSEHGYACLATASLKLFTEMLSYFVINTVVFFLTTDTERTFHFNYKKKKNSLSKQDSIIQKGIWSWNALYLLYLHEKQGRKRLEALHHLISLSYSHWFFVSLFIQNNSTNNSFFLGQQLTELTSIIKGDGAERKMEAHFLRDWFFFF